MMQLVPTINPVGPSGAGVHSTDARQAADPANGPAFQELLGAARQSQNRTGASGSGPSSGAERPARASSASTSDGATDTGNDIVADATIDDTTATPDAT